MALPQWKALEMARHPVAIPVTECMHIPAIMAASRAKVGAPTRPSPRPRGTRRPPPLR